MVSSLFFIENRKFTVDFPGTSTTVVSGIIGFGKGWNTPYRVGRQKSEVSEERDSPLILRVVRVWKGGA
jgi:hypothetical protein